MKDGQLDFSDPAAVRQLSKTLFKVDYHLKLEFPNNRLCPPALSRHNYIMWIKELMDSTTYMMPGAKLLGLDIGTGASCIYPILGCHQRPWSFIATDIDKQNIKWAQKNIDANSCNKRISLFLVDKDGPLIPMDKVTDGTLCFTMTNPPFYKSDEEIKASAMGKARPPPTACTGAEVEMITEGGEVGFVERILNESLIIREEVQWYTAMLGYMSSVTAVVEKLRGHGIDNYAIKEFVQGEKTRRWAVGWSFQAMRPNLSAARGVKGSLAKNILPALTEANIIHLNPSCANAEFAFRFSAAVGALQWISWSWDEEEMQGVGKTGDRIWSRAWRRRGQAERKRKHEQDSTGAAEDEPNKEVLHAFRVYIDDLDDEDEVVVRCRWLEGRDCVAFESFTGYLKATAERVQAEMEAK